MPVTPGSNFGRGAILALLAGGIATLIVTTFTADRININGTSTQTVSAAGDASMYFDTDDNKLYISKNNGAYAELPDSTAFSRLGASNTHTSGTQTFPDTVNSTKTSGNILVWQPSDYATNGGFYFTHESTANVDDGTRNNQIYRWGFGISKDGTLVTDGREAAFDTLETYYAPSAGYRALERHFSVMSDAGTEFRFLTADLRLSGDANPDQISVASRADYWTFNRRSDDAQIFKLDTANTQWSLHASGTHFLKATNNQAIIYQKNAAGSANVTMPFVDSSDEMQLMDYAANPVEVNVGGLGVQNIFRSRGTSGSANKQPIISWYTNGTYEGVISQDAEKFYIVPPDGVGSDLANYQDATVQAAAGLSVTREGVITTRSTGELLFSSATNVTSSADSGLKRRAAGDIEINGGSSGAAGKFSVAGGNAAYCRLQSTTELVTIAAAATTTTSANLLPADSFIVGIVGRVTTAIPTAATFDVGPTGGSADTYANDAAVAVNTTFSSFSHTSIVAPFAQNAANTIVITPNLTPADNTGRLRITVFYYDLTPPGS